MPRQVSHFVESTLSPAPKGGIRWGKSFGTAEAMPWYESKASRARMPAPHLSAHTLRRNVLFLAFVEAHPGERVDFTVEFTLRWRSRSEHKDSSIRQGDHDGGAVTGHLTWG